MWSYLDHINLVSIKHLLNAALADDPNYALIWDRVHHECTADGIDNASADRHQGCRFRHPLLAMVRELGEKLLVRNCATIRDPTGPKGGVAEVTRFLRGCERIL